MVVPWVGFPFAKFVGLCAPLSSAKYVRFMSFYRPQEAIGQREQEYPWPYYEGLRLDEAMNELTLMTTGIYGKPLPRQHGAPLRVSLDVALAASCPPLVPLLPKVSLLSVTSWLSWASSVR